MAWLNNRYLTLLLYFSSFGDARQRCRCLYGQKCWPGNAELQTLANQVSQPLLHPIPPPSACYPSSLLSLPFPPLPGTSNCSDVITNYVDGNWRSDQPGAMENTNFESFIFPNGTIDACYLNVTLGIQCTQGNVPPIGVDVRLASDAQSAVLFAGKHNLRLVVKNTGHDYLGRSAGRGGFMVWTHLLKSKNRVQEFVPDKAPSNVEPVDAVTFGAGVQWHEAYQFVQDQGRFIVGGISLGGSVGSAGGWVMGGGHSAFSPSFGLGVDNVLQFDIVLANGALVTANKYQHPDLFWALRGGGGGTYGVVISTTYRTYPAFPVTMAALIANFTSKSTAQSVVTEFIKLHPIISDAGWGGYTGINQNNFQMLFVAPNVSLSDTNALYKPFFDFITNATTEVASTVTSFPTFLDWYNAFFGRAGQVGGIVELTNRLLPKAITLENPEKVAEIMLSIEGGVATNSIAGGVVSDIDPSTTGLNPSWRGALAEVYVTETWKEGASVNDILSARQRLKQNTNILDQLTTDSGSYLNEGSLYEKDFKKTYFGSHYSKLKAIKEKYDPESLFIVASGVGSDDWDADLVCRR